MLWLEALPEATFWPKAECSHSPSQNIVWSFWRIRNILELQDTTVIFWAPSEFRIKLFIVNCGAHPPSEIIIEINLRISWEGLFGIACAPSESKFKNTLTINWKLSIEVEATVNSNARKVVGANPAPSDFDSPINLRDEIGSLTFVGIKGKICCCKWLFPS